MISPILMQQIRTDLVTWEALLPFMYLDSEGLVTVGCGTMLPTAALAGQLSFFHEKTLKLATSAEVEHHWNELHKGSLTQKAKAPKDKFSSQHYSKSSDLRISRSTADQLRDDHIRHDYDSLKQIYPDFDDFPDTAKLALFDMIYNLGAGRGATKQHRATGLRQYMMMNKAINAGEWTLAASHSSRRGIAAARNRMVHNLLKSCTTRNVVRPIALHAY